MDESEFLSVLHLFPTVRSASFCLEDDGGDEEEAEDVGRHGATKREEKAIPSSSSSSYFEDFEERMHNPPRGYEEEDLFWIRLKEAVEKKLSPADSARFCHAFRKVHENLVHEVLSSEAIGKILKNLKLRHE